jgi:hypothetical protein
MKKEDVTAGECDLAARAVCCRGRAVGLLHRRGGCQRAAEERGWLAAQEGRQL